jgi:membrane associated rhomboid family serine protease
MLEDRDYMREPEYPEPRWSPRLHPRWSWTMVLVIAYAAVFLVEMAVQKFFPGNNFFQGNVLMGANGVELLPGYLPLSVEGLEHGYVWQLLTYQFLHAGLWHILGNCWVIYVFGREMESVLGGGKFLALMFSSGIVGGVFQVLVALAWPQYFGTHMTGGRFFSGETVGASACGFGLVAAYALMFPERELTLLLFFIFPVHLRAKTLLIGSAVLALAGFALPNVIMPGVAHAAHLGGMAMGWFFVRHILQGDWSRLEGFLHPAQKQPSRRPPPEPPGKKPEAGFVESEVDPILDKISAHGIQSLTSREREILESARRHIRRS